MDVEFDDPATHGLHAAGGFSRRHPGRLQDGGFGPVNVVRVDKKCVPQLVGCACELRKHQRPPEVETAGHVLLGDQVHAISQRSDEHDVGGQVQRRHLVFRKGLVQVVDGGLADRRMVAVDPAHYGLDLVTQTLVLFHTLPAGAGHLDQYGIAGVKLAFFEELAVSPQPVQDPLGVVQTVYAQ